MNLVEKFGLKGIEVVGPKEVLFLARRVSSVETHPDTTTFEEDRMVNELIDLLRNSVHSNALSIISHFAESHPDQHEASLLFLDNLANVFSALQYTTSPILGGPDHNQPEIQVTLYQDVGEKVHSPVAA